MPATRSPEPPELPDLAPLALLYHENSKIHAGSANTLGESIAQFSENLDMVRKAVTSAKTYPGARRIALPSRRALPRPKASLEDAMAKRRSARSHGPKPLPFPKLASILEHAGGVTGRLQDPRDPSVIQTVRAAPSGGALFPVETYLAAWNVSGLEAGLYHYHPMARCLETLETGQTQARIAPLVLAGAGVGALLVLAARWRLPFFKYRERGYRILLLDAGHLAQNLLLTASALGVGACPVAGFYDTALGKAFGLDPREEPALYAITLG